MRNCQNAYKNNTDIVDRDSINIAHTLYEKLNFKTEDAFKKRNAWQVV